MHISLSIILSLLPFLPSSTAQSSPQKESQISRPATKDSTIYHSTSNSSCPSCPSKTCTKCTLGHATTLQANTTTNTSDGLASLRWLVAFEMPPLPRGVSAITRCTIQFPGLVRVMSAPVNVTVTEAVSSAWDEDTVSGENAPGELLGREGPLVNVQVPAFANLEALDVTEVCRKVVTGGEFSVYVGTVGGGLLEVWSRDSGNAAILHVFFF
ncbi:hypothetical protein FE257_011186 [Aspergillus nanangensis]|uniref:Uncharacterized protein n=1 Tax=Aspergillus nanangensis TaxID=2582783 RepID=A0AAD4CHZ8_ASPNN|nr:hypothetical protein FE257_011186 [Aspergillus nanangensis]